MVYFKINNLLRVTKRFCSVNSNAKKTMNHKLVLYGDEVSPPVRFVLMAASALDITLDFHNIDLFKEENKSSFFTKINPLQKVPALQIGDDVICDSHAIALYLCRASGAAGAGAGGGARSLYPGDHLTRAKVDQVMFFNSGTLFPIDSFMFTEYFRGNKPTDVTMQQWFSAVDHLEYLLTNNRWLASNKVSLADLCCATTVSSLQLLVPLLDRHLRVQRWLQCLQTLPYYEINARGLERLKSAIHSFK